MSEYRWLTELSQQFLERDYLVEGQTVDERVDEICNAAERILEKPGFAKAFKENIQKGWYSLSTPVWTNFGTDRGLPISCVAGETWINTKSNGGKQAKDIVVGDEVLTHKGRYRKITKVIKTENRRDIYKLKIGTRMTNLYLTGDHPVLTNLGWVRVDSLDPKVHLVAVNREIELEEINHIINMRLFCKYDWLEKDGRIYKKGKETVREDRQVEVVSYYALPFAEIEVTEDVAWALGLWFAEGSISVNDRGLPNGARVTLGLDEKHFGYKWLDIIRRDFGIDGNAYEGEAERDGTVNRWFNINVNSTVVGNFFAAFGKDCKKKTIPDWIIALPSNLLRSFLQGLLLGDGTVRLDGSNKLTLANPQLVLQAYQIALKLGLGVSLQMQEKAGKLSSTSYVYTIRFRSPNLKNRYSSGFAIPFSDGLYYCHIRTLEKTNKTKTVYDFTVEEDHSFSAAGVILHNCFGSYIEDNMESILYTHSEVGMMTKHGGGTSAYFGNLRGRGEKIRKNGESSGSVHFMKLFENLINIVSQGATRRGNFAAYIDIDHKDILEFLQIRNEGFPIQDLSFGVCVTDKWMQAMIDGDKEKRKVWAKVLESRAHKGYPYIFFVDNANNNTVDVYKDKGMKISHSNLCVTGDQWVVTSKGMRQVYDLYKSQENLTLFDGEKAVFASPMKLIERSVDVYEIITEAGRTHKVTGYHKVKTKLGMVEAKDLIPGTKICVQNEKGLFGNIYAPQQAFLLGLYQGDGTQTDETVFIDLWENDFDLIPEVESCVESIYKLNGWLTYEVTVPNRGQHTRSTIVPTFCDQSPSENGVLKKRLQSAKLKQTGFEKGKIPEWIWCANEQTQWQYIRGLLFTDGTVTLGSSKGEPIQLSITSTNLDWLREIQILMSNLGLKPSIHLSDDGGRKLMPDGKGGKKQYLCKAKYRLIVSNKPDSIEIEKATGFLTRKGVTLEDREYRDNTKKFDTVKEVRHVGKEDVYCTTVKSDEHLWVCNSFITSNCTEIMLPDNEQECFVCDLSSMNLLYYDEWKDTNAVELIVYFLDAVMTEFIEKAEKISFMERPVRFAKRHRALGLGVLGWHSYLQSKMIPFESMEAKYLNVAIAKKLKEDSYKASAKLAKEYGEPEVLKDYGRRNTTLMAIAPTKSSAFILGQVSEQTEPNRANIVVKDLQKGKFTMRNPYLEALLEQKGKNDEATWTSILKMGGSVQHLDFLTDHEKAVYKTFSEISMKEVIIQASQRQKYLDQAQSLNIMIHPEMPIKEVNNLIIEAWKLGIKSFYYQYSINSCQKFSRDLLTCKNCES